MKQSKLKMATGKNVSLKVLNREFGMAMIVEAQSTNLRFMKVCLHYLHIINNFKVSFCWVTRI
jgi:hypothetical protein